MAEGEFALVRQHLEAARLKPHSIRTLSWGDHDFYALLADAAAQQRDLAALQEYAPQALALAEQLEHRFYQALAQRAWGVLHRLEGDYDAALARLSAALNIFRALDTQWQIGRTLVELGELAHTRGDESTARQHLTEALAAFQSLGALPDVTRTRAALRALG
jgi:tetratricopeptide (TPR) repeat protein